MKGKEGGGYVHVTLYSSLVGTLPSKLIPSLFVDQKQRSSSLIKIHDSMAEKPPPEVAEQAVKNRIITHMNNDHQDSLVRYLEHYCHLSSSSARHARLVDITFDQLVISTHADAGRRTYTVPIQPAMTSWPDARPRVVAMDAEAVAGLQRSNITVKRYEKPTWFTTLVICLVIFNLIVFPRRRNFLPGSLFYDNVLVYVPGFARLCLRMRPTVLLLIGLVHPAEMWYMYTSGLRRHTVPTFSVLWWKWIVSVMFEGYGAMARFNRVVAEEERKRASAKH